MRIEMIRARGYRGNHLEAGTVNEVDATTGRWFISAGWAREYADAEPLAPAAAAEAAPTNVKRRKALR